jgi:hypothetical protein
MSTWQVMLFLAGILAWPFALWVLYLAYCTLRVSEQNGKFAMTPWPVKVFSYTALAVGWLLDVAFNMVAGSVMFLEPPHELTFTDRCSRHMDEPNWRGKIARWVCDGWLNPMEAGHCHPD